MSEAAASSAVDDAMSSHSRGLTRRMVAGGLILAPAAVMAGCFEGFRQTGNSDASPAETLLRAAGNLARSSLTINVRKTRWYALLKLDPPAGKGLLLVNSTKDGQQYQLSVTWSGREMWISEATGGVLSTQYTHISAEQAQAAGLPEPMPSDDPTGAVALIKLMKDLRLAGKVYEGTIDLTVARKVHPLIAIEFGQGAQAVPAFVTVDAQDRLTSITIGEQSSRGGPREITYAGFGRQIGDVEPRPEQVTEASEQYVTQVAPTLLEVRPT